MNKQTLAFTVVGIIIGFIGGFVMSNTINRNAVLNQTSAANTPAANAPFAGTQNQPAPNAPPGGGMMPDIAEKLSKAQAEPNNFDAQTSAGDMYAQINRFEKAVEFYERADKARPGDFKTIIKLASGNFELGKFAEAEKWYEKALKLKPEDPDIRSDLGLTFYLREPKDLERAVKEYETVLAKNPDHELTLQNYAAALREKGDRATLQNVIARLEKVNPKNPVISKYQQELSGK